MPGMPTPGGQQPALGTSPGGPPGQPGQPGQPVGPPPAPTVGQTVAALRHFDAIRHQLDRILRDPALGKSNIKSKIVDGVAELVADRMMTPGAAVEQLATVPERPFDQRTWAQQHMQTAIQAQLAVLAHHGQAFAGVPDGLLNHRAEPSEHLDDMASLQQHYKPAGAASPQGSPRGALQQQGPAGAALQPPLTPPGGRRA